MPIWLIIMAAGATGCGWLFLKAREQEKALPYKKLKRESLTVAKAARRAAGRPSTAVPVAVADYSMEPVEMSRSRVGVAAQAPAGVLPDGLTLAGYRNLYPSIPTFEEYKVEHPEYRGNRALYYGSHGIVGG